MNQRAGSLYRARARVNGVAGVLYVLIGPFVILQSVHASCLPLAFPDLHELDGETEERPDEAVREAQRRLATAVGNTNMLRAQLFAIIADAELERSQPDPARAALESARAELRSLPPSPELRRLKLRLALAAAQLSIIAADNAAAVDATGALLRDLPDESLERACTLSMRATAYDYSYQIDKSVGDALVAYRIAQTGNWPNARLEAAATLARIFGRAGLYPQAERMIDVIIGIATADKKTALLSTVEYEKGVLLVKERRFADARAALARANGYAMQTGDRFAVAADNASLCWALLNEGDLDRADRICSTGDADLASGHRPDLDTLLIGYRARLDLDRQRPLAALAKLNGILTPALHTLLPGFESEFHWDRARALYTLHRYREASEDLKLMHDLDVAADVAQQNRQVAVLSAMIASESLVAANRQLKDRMVRQQENAIRQRDRGELWLTLSVSALTISALLAYLLWISRRHHRSLRHREIILSTASLHAPDAFLLLDEQRRVRFANRNLCGNGPTHRVGEPVASSLPATLAPTLTTAIDEAFQRRTVVNFSVTIADGGRALRQFEMCVVPAVDREHLIGGTLRAIDVTDRLALERKVVDGASFERQRLSSELHEGLGQQLAGVLLLLGNASKVVQRGLPNAAILLEEITDAVRQGLDDTRELARGLAPVKIVSGSLSAALQGLVRDSARRLRIAVECICELEDIVLSDLAADHLFRICREAVNNAALHGRCSEVHLDVSIQLGVIQMSICDDGLGIPSGGPESGGLGVKMMAYRARLLGGDFKMTPRPAGGTCVLVTVPLAQVTDDFLPDHVVAQT